MPRSRYPLCRVCPFQPRAITPAPTAAILTWPVVQALLVGVSLRYGRTRWTRAARRRDFVGTENARHDKERCRSARVDPRWRHLRDRNARKRRRDRLRQLPRIHRSKSRRRHHVMQEQCGLVKSQSSGRKETLRCRQEDQTSSAIWIETGVSTATPRLQARRPSAPRLRLLGRRDSRRG